MTPLAEALTPARLEEAWRRVRRSPGAGVDGMHGGRFERGLSMRLASIRQDLLDGTYQPSALLRRVRPKPDGGERVLGIPTLADRVAQCAVLLSAADLDGALLHGVHGYRPGRSHATALRHLIAQIGHQPTLEIVQADIRALFDELEHTRVQRALSCAWSDPLWVELNRRWIGAWPTTPGRGIPQGAPLSPLLANLTLAHHLDPTLQAALDPSSGRSPSPGGLPRVAGRMAGARSALHRALFTGRATEAAPLPGPELCAWIRYGDDLVLASGRRGGATALLAWLDAAVRAAGLALGDRKTVASASRSGMPLPRPVLGVALQFQHGLRGWSLAPVGPLPLAQMSAELPWEKLI